MYNKKMKMCSSCQWPVGRDLLPTCLHVSCAASPHVSQNAMAVPAGAIMFEETLYQSSAGGTPFVDILREQGIVPGIKVDTGLQVSRHFRAPCLTGCKLC